MAVSLGGTAGGEEVAEQYMCPICREVLKKPTATRECNHRFCGGCLFQTRPGVDGGHLCPLCRVPFQLSAVYHDQKFETELSGAFFTCRGCKHKLPLLVYNGHQSTCRRLNQSSVPKFNPVPVGHTSQETPVALNRLTFNCPLCGIGNLECEGLREHVNQVHGNTTASVVCPICASMPWGNPDQKSGNFVAHLNLRHQFEYETFVDYDRDEDAILQETLKESMNDL